MRYLYIIFLLFSFTKLYADEKLLYKGFGVAVYTSDTDFVTSKEQLEGLHRNQKLEQLPENNSILGYYLSHIIKFEKENKKEIKVNVWSPVLLSHPGHRPPIVVVYKNEKIINIQKLEEVSFPTDVWASNNFGNLSLYVKNGQRFRKADSTQIYSLDSVKGLLDYQSECFEKDELIKESCSQQGVEADPIIHGNFENEPHK